MQRIGHALELIENSSSRTIKLNLLKQCGEEIDGFKEVVRFIYNPYCRTGISKAKLAKAKQTISPTTPVTDFREAIAHFSAHTTGSSEDLEYAINFIAGADGRVAERVAEAIITQELKIGVTATSLNEAYGDSFIPKIGCMLGTPYGNLGNDKIHWPCIVTEKLDGVRRVLVKENGVCRMYSRAGHEDVGLVDIIDEAKFLPDNYVYDGELLAEGTFKDCIALRQATNSIANCKGNRTGLTFNVFDMVPVDEFYAGVSSEPAVNRKILLGATLRDTSIQCLDDDWWRRIQAFGLYVELEHIKPVPILGVVSSLVDAEPIVERIWERGGEGIMLNSVTAPYEVKRSKGLIKVKRVEELVLRVVDLIEGEGKYEGKLGCIVVDYKGSKVGVGTGFTDAQREVIWADPDRFIGLLAEIDTFGESTNAQGYVSLNCPVFKAFRTGSND